MCVGVRVRVRVRVGVGVGVCVCVCACVAGMDSDLSVCLNESGHVRTSQPDQLRKPADRLGKVVLANEVSIRGSGAWTWREGPEAQN